MNNASQKPVNSIWITANAGSGKTYALTQRVVGLMLRGVQPERICCITYTKAAASEMRSRVLNRLRDLLLADDARCRAMVEEILGARADDAQIAQARRLFGTVLDSVSGGLQLTTIHGFCQQILRQFPLEAEVAPHFTVLDESAADAVLRRVKHQVLQTDYMGSDVVAALSLLGERMGESRFDDVLADIIGKRLTWAEVWRGMRLAPGQLRARVFEMHGLADDAAADGLDVWLATALSAEQEALLRAALPSMSAHKKKTEQKYAAGLAPWLAADEVARREMISELCTLMLTDGALRKEIAKLEHYEAVKPLAEAAARYHAQLSALACAEESFAVALLAREILLRYEQAKAEMAALDYDDLINATRKLFSHPETLGWVMSKLDHRIDHLLIDEAQDTSGEQWSIAQLLVEELIAANEGVGSGNQPRSLLVVGDEKQSIYSFQGARPELFAQKYEEFERLLAGSYSPLARDALATSYRSASSVLKLVDAVAHMPNISPALSAGGITPEHRVHRAQASGKVTLYEPIAAPEKETVAPFTLPMHSAAKQTPALLMAEKVAALLEQWLHTEKRMLESEGRPLHAGDILILVHRRKPMVLPLIRALERRHIPVAGLDRLTLCDHLAVKDLLALMRWCGNTADDLALAQVLRSPIIGMSDEALRALAYGRSGALWAEVQSPTLARWHGMRHAQPYEFLTDVLEVQSGRSQFARRFGAEVHEVLDELKAQAAAMPEHMQLNLSNFVDWIAGSKRQIKREQSDAAGQVRIMTVHGAKGLEAPVVLMVDTASVPTTQNEIVFFPRTKQQQMLPAIALSEIAKSADVLVAAKQKKSEALLAEYQRLLYVALTRARDELHVFGTMNKGGNIAANSWYATVQMAMLELGAVEESGTLVVMNSGVVKEISATAPKRERAALPSWAKAAAPAYASSARMASPSHLVAMEPAPYATAAVKGAKERGVRIHRVLELLRAESDVGTIAQLVAHIAPNWSAEEQLTVAAEIAALHAQENWLWQHKNYAEASICGVVEMDGVPVPFNGQMDLLVVTPAAVIVLDYKTGRHVPASAQGVSANYLLQLKTYRALVQQIYPDRPIKLAILWTAVPQIMWLDEVVAAIPWPKLNVSQESADAA